MEKKFPAFYGRSQESFRYICSVLVLYAMLSLSYISVYIMWQLDDDTAGPTYVRGSFKDC